MEKMDGNGFTLVYIPWDNLEGRPRVVGRFKTIKEKNKFLDQIFDVNSGWLPEELGTLCVMDDYNYRLPF